MNYNVSASAAARLRRDSLRLACQPSLTVKLARERMLAEREGFEPPVPFRVQWFSRPPPSTTRPSLPPSSRRDEGSFYRGLSRRTPAAVRDRRGKKISHDRGRVASGSKTCGDFDTPGALSHTRSHDTVAEHGCMTQRPRAKWRVLWSARSARATNSG